MPPNRPDLLWLFQHGPQVRHDLLCDLARRRQVFGVLQAFVAGLEDVHVGLVPLRQLVVGEPTKPFSLLPLRPVVGAVAGHEAVQVRPGQRIGLEG